MSNNSNVKIEPTTTLNLDPINLRVNSATLSNDLDTQKRDANNNRFINFNEVGMDLKKFSDIFNSYATKKTFATGFFNLALVATNFAQMKQLITYSTTKSWNPMNIVILTFVCVSLFLQFIVAIALVFLAKQGEFIDDDKRNQLIRSNNGVTVLVLLVSIINIFINVFISV